MLSEIGKIVEEEWQKTSKIRECVNLDAWGIMPNHLHGILIIKNEIDMPRGNLIMNVETPRRGISTSKWKPDSLGSILNQFKSICTKRIRNLNCSDFYWQSRFYDHIIRDEKSLHEIREYIHNNPLKWNEDKNNPKYGKSF